MKKLYFLFLGILISSLSFGQDLKITGAFDGPLTGGVPKAIELYVVNNITDLSIYGIGSANNGGGTDGVEFVFSGSASAGDFLYLATTDTDFNSYFGFDPDFLDGSAGINGDDAIELFYDATGAFAGSEIVIDVFGDIDTDGSGTAWDYLDGWAYRVSGTGLDGSTFTIANWTFSGINAADGCTTNASCGSVFPIGSYSNTLSTNQNQINDFKIYPNPTSLGYINISSRNNTEINISVFDVLGKQVINETGTNSRLDVTNLKAGVYIMKATEQDAVSTKKLVIR